MLQTYRPYKILQLNALHNCHQHLQHDKNMNRCRSSATPAVGILIPHIRNSLPVNLYNFSAHFKRSRITHLLGSTAMYGVRCGVLLLMFCGLSVSSVCLCVRWHNRKPCRNGWTDWDAVWDVNLQGPRNHVVGGGARNSLGARALLGVILVLAQTCLQWIFSTTFARGAAQCCLF